MVFFKKQFPSCPPSNAAVKLAVYTTPLHGDSPGSALLKLTQSAMHSFKVYAVDGRVKSLTVTFPYSDFSPLGQSTLHRIVKIESSDPSIVVKFWPGHGFAATPCVPEVTGAEEVVDALAVAVVLCVDTDDVDDNGDVCVVVELVFNPG